MAGEAGGTGASIPGTPLDNTASVFEELLNREEAEKQPPKKPKAEKPPESVVEETPEEPEVEEVPAAVEPAEEESEEEEPRYRVKVDGEEFEVSQSELLAGYSRTQDYSKKTMAVAEQRKTLAAAEKAATAEKAAIVEERKTIARDAALFEQALKAMQPQEPDWDTLRNTVTPDQYAAAYTDWQIQQNRVRIAEDKRRQADARVDADKATAYQSYLRDQNTQLLERIPEWQDAKVREADAKAMRAHAKTLGFSDQQIDAVDDANTMVLVRNSMLKAKAETARPTVQATISRIKSATPGGAQTPRKPVSDRAKAAATLKRTGSVADAAKLFEHLIDS